MTKPSKCALVVVGDVSNKPKYEHDIMSLTNNYMVIVVCKREDSSKNLLLQPRIQELYVDKNVGLDKALRMSSLLIPQQKFIVLNKVYNGEHFIS
jgi:hypothetical protein